MEYAPYSKSRDKLGRHDLRALRILRMAYPDWLPPHETTPDMGGLRGRYLRNLVNIGLAQKHPKKDIYRAADIDWEPEDD